MTLPEFLLARIAEDGRHARLVIERGSEWDAPPISPERTLAECEAKRRIVAAADAAADGWSRKSTAAALLGIEVLAILALPYSDHPDYDESWRP